MGAWSALNFPLKAQQNTVSCLLIWLNGVKCVYVLLFFIILSAADTPNS